ncbi:DUF4862 family protein [Gammaproteobacteria bacterium]|nr:DUF4862 family protein [Gammaproteobacteria bacterium]
MDYIIGAYTSAPSIWKDDYNSELEFYEALKSDVNHIRGLEIPFLGDKLHPFGDNFIFDQLDDSWNNVITAVPASFNMSKTDIHFGLASDDECGRKSALKQYRILNDIVRKLNDLKGRNTISHMQICSSPTQIKDRVSVSKDSFLKSIEELLSLDWDGAKILIEHCDSPKDKQEFQKGYLSLNDEIKVLDKLKDQRMGILLNWGRSVLEGRNRNEIIKHIRISKDKGYLKGLIFSGTAKDDENYGRWMDLHMPFKNESCPHLSFKNSLLTKENIMLTLGAIDIKSMDYLGIKLHPLPHEDFSPRERVEINKYALVTLEKLLAVAIT